LVTTTKKTGTVEISIHMRYIIYMNIIGDVERSKTPKLMAVFWDYPKFRDENHLRQFINDKKGKSAYYWIMNRFLQYGRVVDTFLFFDVKEISKNLDKMQLSEYAAKKWKRLIEVYG
jgi:hypothetical protein